MRKRRFLIFLILIPALLFIFILVTNAIVNFGSSARIYGNGEEIQESQTVLILGAAVYSNGELSPVFKSRVDKALELYRAKKVSKILASGDNSTVEHNEVNPVRNYLLAKGIPDADIFLDHAGFDTYSTMYRARDIFKVSSVIVVTQSFHLPRAVFIARALGLDAYGVPANDEHVKLSNYIREIFANEKAILNIIFNRQPKYLGKAIPIDEDKKIIPIPPALPKACTEEAKLCPDGSAVGRTGPNCEFAPCPRVGSELSCTKNSDCPSSKYICQETQGTGTVCSSTDPTCVPTYTIVAGECKLKEGSRCSADSDCASGNLCHKNICTSPIGRECNGPSDQSCGADFECVQGCGSPVGYEGEPPPPYFCQLKGYVRTCPICLAKSTLIDTPLGAMPVQDLQIGMPIWTVNSSGHRALGFVLKTSKTSVPPEHKMVQFVLADGRALLVSPGHPTILGRTVGDLVLGDLYDTAKVVSIELVSYGEKYTYDILPTGQTGFYFANGILLGSTLSSR